MTRDAANKLSTFNGSRWSNQHKSELAAVTCLNDVCAQEMLPSAEHNMPYRLTHVPADPPDTRRTARPPARRQFDSSLNASVLCRTNSLRICDVSTNIDDVIRSAVPSTTWPPFALVTNFRLAATVNRSFCHKTLIYQYRPVSSDT